MDRCPYMCAYNYVSDPLLYHATAEFVPPDSSLVI